MKIFIYSGEIKTLKINHWNEIIKRIYILYIKKNYSNKINAIYSVEIGQKRHLY